MKFKSSWHWYGVRGLSKITVEGETPEKESFMENTMLVRAQSHAQACKIAQRRFTRQNLSYRNIYGQTVSREFSRIIGSYFFEEGLKTGTTVYSCIYDVPAGEDPERILRRFMLRG